MLNAFSDFVAGDKTPAPPKSIRDTSGKDVMDQWVFMSVEARLVAHGPKSSIKAESMAGSICVQLYAQVFYGHD